MELKPELQAFDRLLTIMNELREKCPWDRKQTIESLRHLTIEETYELADAITAGDSQELKKELGDILLHIVFYAKIASETNQFDITQVINSLCDKLIERHPHIYGDVTVKDENEVKQNWEKIKLKTGNKSVLSGVPSSMPSIVKAYRMQEKAAQVGFDWPNIQQVWDKVEEEMREFREETDPVKSTEEFGDLLFSLINYARFAGINPDDALEKTNLKFKSRFEAIEEAAKGMGRQIETLSLAEMDAIWNLAKGKNSLK